MKYLVIATFVIAVAVVAGYFLFRSSETKPVTASSKAVSPKNTSSATRSVSRQEVWAGLRQMVLTLKPQDMGAAPGSVDTYGFIMEIGYQRGDTKITVVALSDGTMSMYLSNGGGVLGTGQRSPEIAQVGKDAIKRIAPLVKDFEMTAGFPVPETGRVRFFVLTGKGVRTRETDLATLESGADPLAPLWNEGNKVLTQIRIADQGRR